MLHYDQLIAPALHGGVLVAPAANTLVDVARKNAVALGVASATILNRPLAEWRRLTRERHLPDGTVGKPVIIVGHQPGLIHSGVWAKNVVAHRLAHCLSGTALHLIVDSDSPRNLFLRVPALLESRWTVRSLKMGTLRPGCAFEQLPPISRDDLATLRSEVEAILDERVSRSSLPAFFSGFHDAHADWVAQMTAGRKAIERQFAVELADLRIRDAWWSPLAAHLIFDAPEFARHYNDAIGHYRHRFNVHSPNRPVPPLHVESDRVELPFWLFDDTHPRARAFLRESNGHFHLDAGFERVIALTRREIESSDDLILLVQEKSGWRLRPRALITTMWSRLFLAELFIHGIGGAKYDRITDSIIEGYFGLPAPGIACVTATLYFDPNCNTAISSSELERRIRDLTWNPQRASNHTAEPAFHDLADQKLAAVEESQSLARLDPTNHAARKSAFDKIRRLNPQLAALNLQAIRDAQQQLEQTRHAQSDRRALCDREYFFALHPRTSLDRLLAALPGEADFVPI